MTYSIIKILIVWASHNVRSLRLYVKIRFFFYTGSFKTYDEAIRNEEGSIFQFFELKLIHIVEKLLEQRFFNNFEQNFSPFLNNPTAVINNYWYCSE